MMNENDWIGVRIRKGVIKQIDEIITKKVDITLTNRSQFIDLAIREKLNCCGVFAMPADETGVQKK